ncbi:MAG: DMT family transporter [Planctomycetota bacterium]
MMQLLGLVFLALGMGFASCIQGATNGTLAARVGLWSAVLVNAAVVFVGAVALFLWHRGGTVTDTQPGRPWFLFVGGCYGLLIIAGAAYSFPRLGAGPTTALMIAGQLTLALAFDHFGVPVSRTPLTLPRALGAVFLFVGALLVLWPKLVQTWRAMAER